MRKTIVEKLKNPVWFSLNETHAHYTIDFDKVKFYHPNICTFGAFLDTDNTFDAMNAYAELTDKFFLVSENKTPLFDESNLLLYKKIEGCQMVLNSMVDYNITEEIIELTEEYIDEIYDLIWLVMPGYYRRRTFDMGKYYGVFKEGRLVAITGQRMQTDDFIEVSAVVTHPDYTKRGLAKQLVTHTTKEILKTNKTPILHTNKGNKAIPLYENLGYEITRDMNWWYFHKK